MPQNWLTKIAWVFRGEPFPGVSHEWTAPTQERPIEYDTDGTPIYPVYQAPTPYDFVFLGGARIEEIDQVEKMYGRPPCFRISLTNEDTKDLPGMEIVKEPLQVLVQWGHNSPDMDVNRDSKEARNRYLRAVERTRRVIEDVYRRPPAERCPVYVHCSAGMNRSPAVLARVLADLTHQESGRDFVTEMREARPIVRPSDGYFYLLDGENPDTATSLDQQKLRNMSLEEQMNPMRPPSKTHV